MFASLKEGGRNEGDGREGRGKHRLIGGGRARESGRERERERDGETVK